jgi:hypothetical protein
MFQKLIAGLLIVALSTSAFARNVTVTFSNGETHRYENAPDNITPDMVEQRARADFPNLRVVNIDGGKQSPSLAAVSSPAPEPKATSFWDNKVVQFISTALLVVAVIAIGASGGGSGNPCDYSWQTASDGSHCGGRAANVRPGGR